MIASFEMNAGTTSFASETAISAARAGAVAERNLRRARAIIARFQDPIVQRASLEILRERGAEAFLAMTVEYPPETQMHNEAALFGLAEQSTGDERRIWRAEIARRRRVRAERVRLRRPMAEVVRGPRRQGAARRRRRSVRRVRLASASDSDGPEPGPRTDDGNVDSTADRATSPHLGGGR